MSFELCAGKKKNREGRVELSVRFRLGKIDMQARTNLWVSPNFIKSEKYISSKGRQSVRLVLTSSRTKSAEAVNADDVKATHGASTGQLDESALFYMQQRCLSEQTARRLLIGAFMKDVLETISDDAQREQLVQAIDGVVE